jgi:hypothetical protein
MLGLRRGLTGFGKSVAKGAKGANFYAYGIGGLGGQKVTTRWCNKQKWTFSLKFNSRSRTIRVVAEHPPADGEHHRPMTAHHRREGFLVARVEERVQELAVGAISARDLGDGAEREDL